MLDNPDSPSAVVLLDIREHTPGHEHASHAKLADCLAQLLAVPHIQAQPPVRAGERYYYVPTETLTDPATCKALGIHTEQDLFGGMVSHPHMATKAISHPLLPGSAGPPGWTDDFARHAGDALLQGYSVFSKADAHRAASLLLRHGSVRVKPVQATAGRGQRVITQLAELEAMLEHCDTPTLALFGLVLEENLSQVQTLSVGQVRVAGLTLSYHGSQQLTRDNQGIEVYGGSDLLLVRGGYQALLAQVPEPHLRLAIEQAVRYEQAAELHLPGFTASRRNYDIARGRNPGGQLRSGVLEQSWRLGGASGAEVLALLAFAADPALQQLRASTHEVFGEASIPADATLFYQGDDRELGRLSKYARIREHEH